VEPTTMALAAMAAGSTLAGLFGAQAQAEEARRQRLLQGSLAAYGNQQQSAQGGASSQQQAFERLIQNMSMGGRQ